VVGFYEVKNLILSTGYKVKSVQSVIPHCVQPPHPDYQFKSWQSVGGETQCSTTDFTDITITAACTVR
jgi:hypothetical protein